MENTYGIGIANRYDMFYDQDDVTEFETVIAKKKEKKLKEPAQQTQATTPATATQPKSAAEKENKQVKKASLDNGTGQQKAAPEQQRRGIKEQQNNSNKDLSTGQRKEGDNKGFSNNNSRPAFNKSGGNGENREERNNRRNRELNGNVDFEKPRTGAVGGNSGAPVGQRNQNRRNFDGRKRERDRQSGSDKTGVKAVDKRDGSGKGNWGSHKQDIDDLNKPPTDDEQKEGGEEAGEETVAPAPEEPKEMTLDEWKAQRQAQLLQPQYNLRKAGEGEDNAQWDKMKRLDKKSGDGEIGKKDDGYIANKKEVDAKKKQVLDIEFHFNDGRRGGLGRRPGPGRGGPGGQGGQNRRPRPNREGGDRKDGDESQDVGGEHRERRPPRRPRFENRRGDFHGNDKVAPKVNDERDFPSLG